MQEGILILKRVNLYLATSISFAHPISIPLIKKKFSDKSEFYFTELIKVL